MTGNFVKIFSYFAPLFFGTSYIVNPPSLQPSPRLRLLKIATEDKGRDAGVV